MMRMTEQLTMIEERLTKRVSEVVGQIFLRVGREVINDEQNE